MQVNERLYKEFPKLPKGYRWKVRGTFHDGIIGIGLEKRGLFFWKTICYAAAVTRQGDHEAKRKAQRMYDDRWGDDSLIGVTER